MDSIIDQQLIKLNIDNNSKEEVIKELAQLMDNQGRLNSLDGFVEEVLKREELSTTGIGFGVAIPHGKTNAVKIPTVVFGRAEKGVEWQALDEKPVYMVFLLAVPKEAVSNVHLKILAALSRKLMNEDFRQNLLEINSKEKLIESLEDVFSMAN